MILIFLKLKPVYFTRLS